jgi:hypothetical protein
MALLLDSDGGVVAAAPQAPPGSMAALAAELYTDTVAAFAPDGEPVELDAACEGGAVFLVRSSDGALVCLTDRSVLPPLIFYDMHAVLMDLDRAADAEARRVGAAEG